MKEKTIPFQFRIRTFLKDFLKTKNPKNQSLFVNELIQSEKTKEDIGKERYRILRNPDKSLSHIKNCALSGEIIESQYYAFMIDKIHSLTRTGKDTADSDKQLTAFLDLASDIYKEITNSGRKVDSEDFIASRISIDQTSLQEAILSVKSKLATQGYSAFYFENILRVLSLLISEEGFQYIKSDNVFRPYLSVLIELTDESLKKTAQEKSDSTAKDIEHESKVMNAFANKKENEHPIIYGNDSNPLRASVCTASIYTDNKQDLTIVLRETGIGYASITNFVEQISKSVIDKYIPNELIENTSWYQIERGFSNKEECDKVSFEYISKNGVVNPKWTKIDMNYFKNEIMTTLEDFQS